MILPRFLHWRRRRGAHAVELAFVAPIVLLFLFGVLEYCRFLFTVQVMNSAAREGARYAVVNTTATLTTSDIQTYVDQYITAQGAAQLEGYNAATSITVFQADPDTGADNGQGWTNAGWGAPIGVSVSGTYKPILPGMLLFATSIPVKSTCIMYSEAN